VGKATDWANTSLFYSRIYKLEQLTKRYYVEERISISEILSKNVMEIKRK